MTAEIAILNKGAIALAADSTVTVSRKSKRARRAKTYNTVNKLFTLSKYHPIGVMIYGNDTLMGVPWETVIKQFRHLRKQEFGTVEEYGTSLISYLEVQPRRISQKPISEAGLRRPSHLFSQTN